jgi:hypothetical protein
VVGDDQGDVGEELSAPPAPEQFGEAVVIARDQERHALAPGGERESPAHSERLRDLGGERLLERPLVGVAGVQPEFDPHDEEAAIGFGRVLIRLQDVGSTTAEELRHRGDDARTFDAGEQQPSAPFETRQAHPRCCGWATTIA